MDNLGHHIGYQFTDEALLRHALTHTSHRDTHAHKHDFERLEILGDAILGAAVVEMLFTLYPNEREGELARRKSALVARPALAKIAQIWHIPQALRLSGAEDARGGRKQSTTLEDACEAIIGAIFLDGGWMAAREVIWRYWEPLAKENAAAPKDARTALQEWAQARGLPLPQYRVISQTGSDHQPYFEAEVAIAYHGHASAKGASKKQAYAVAAEKLLAELEKIS